MQTVDVDGMEWQVKTFRNDLAEKWVSCVYSRITTIPYWVYLSDFIFNFKGIRLTLNALTNTSRIFWNLN
jgi:hypothetical protein